MGFDKPFYGVIYSYCEFDLDFVAGLSMSSLVFRNASGGDLLSKARAKAAPDEDNAESGS